MHLRAVKLRGFKSFPDPVELRLEPGVAVVVGPNGSGKSNISDAIVWAAGSLTPSQLRAEKPDDVLFAGAADRNQADHCEVELLFDNSAGDGPLEFSELSIARRLHRGGEGQYLVNGAAVRRLDLVDLLSDLGLGDGMHSIISQGRVEEVLASRPEDRRALVEEAAGLGKFKRRRHRAELKLARVQIQVERARDVEQELRKRLRPLAMQASAAERAEKLRDQVRALEARIAQLDRDAATGRLAATDSTRAQHEQVRTETQERLAALLAEREQAEQELGDATGAREQRMADLYRLRSSRERLELRIESLEGMLTSIGPIDAEPDELAAQWARRAELERAFATAAGSAREAGMARDRVGEEVEAVRLRVAGLERALAEREGIPPAARALAESGERLALSQLEVEPGYERAVAAALAWRGAAVTAKTPEDGFALLERARAEGLGSLAVLLPRMPAPVGGIVPGESLIAHVEGDAAAKALLAGVAVVPQDELLQASSGVVVTREGHGYDADRGELWFWGDAAEKVLLELAARHRDAIAELGQLETALEVAQATAAEADRAVAAAEAELGRAPAPSTRPRDAAVLRAIADVAQSSLRILRESSACVAAIEEPLRLHVDTGSSRVSELGERLRKLGADEVSLRQVATEASERLAALGVERARIEADLADAERRLEQAGVEPAEGDDRDELALKLNRSERRLEELGRVNPLAKEEYEAEKERVEELATQRADLEQSLEELEKLRAELTETVERRFAETFEAVERNFAEIAGTLFVGGEGRLRLTDPEDEDEEPGIEVELRPAGKKVTKLSLLSGGEKALGAISFLFALFLAHPCPFYLLDEVEAALDDTNIGRFVELLRRYADRAQFVVITHQKRTMEAADLLYGVTMSGDGVSQLISRRVPRDDKALAVA